MSYTQFGPWADGGAPGISAEFLNPLETFLLSLNSASYDPDISSDGAGGLTVISALAQFNKLNPTGVVLNGSTSGTATLYQPMRGTWKEVFIVLNNFRNSGGTTQTLAIPVPFTTFCRIEAGALFQIALQISSTAQNISVLTALAAAGGSVATQTDIAAHSVGSCQAAIDTIGFLSGGSGGVTSIVYLRGV